MLRVLSLGLVLSLSVLMVLPGTYTPVRAVNQSGPTRFSPFGPFTQQMLIHFYSGFDPMFSAFQQGQIDISDWSLQSSSQINSFCSNPDFYCTSPAGPGGYFGLQINNHPSFMGIQLLQPRTVSPISFTITGTTPGCSTGFGSLQITLRNMETGATILDSLNTLTLRNQPSGSPSVTIDDSGGSSPNGVYNVPCTLAGSYSVASSVYNSTGIATAISGGTTTSGVLNVNWNSLTAFNATQARSLLGAAVAHLIDDPEFVNSIFGLTAQAPCANGVTSQGIACPTGTSTTYQGGLGTPAPGGPPSQIDVAECQFNNHPWLNVIGCSPGATGHDIGPYNIADDKISVGSEFWNTGTSSSGQGYSGHDDLRAACDDFVSMGFSLSPSTATCNDVANAAVGTVDPGTYAHIAVPAALAGTLAGQIKTYIRSNFGRQQFGQIIADTLNFLFGTPQNRATQVGFVGTVCYDARTTPCTQFTPKYYSFSQVTPIVFADTAASGGSPDAWQLYTGSHSVGFFPADQYFLNHNSIETGGICAGKSAIYPNNDEFWCDPQTDTFGSAGELAPMLSLSERFFQRELVYELNRAVDIPGFTFVNMFVENNGWNFQQCASQCASTQASIVNTEMQGTTAGGAYFTLLNARQVPGYDPCTLPGAPVNCASYKPGGGNPNLIRRGFSQDTAYLSPFTFISQWEFEIVSLIFDTMLQPNPVVSGSSQLIDWGTTSHSATFNPSEVGCNSITGCVTGVTTQIWHIRNDWKFSDGNDVKATDVAYSIIAYRDVPSGGLQSYVFSVVSAKGLDCGPGQPCKTLQVKLQGQSSLNEFNIGANPLVLEKSLWAPYCGDPPIAGGVCASPTFDPMYPSGNAPGIMVGPGPWACISPIAGTGVPAGHIGGPCSRDASGKLVGSAITLDGTVLLSENTNFARCCPTGATATSSSLYKLSYADHSHDGIVNILDLADVASKFGTADPYWVNPNIASDSTVGLRHLGLVALYFGHGITTPYTPTTLVGVDPQTNPFFCPATGC